MAEIEPCKHEDVSGNMYCPMCGMAVYAVDKTHTQSRRDGP